MKKLLLFIFLFVTIASFGQGTQRRLGIDSASGNVKAYTDTVVVAPYIANYFINGNVRYQKFDSTVRLSLSLDTTAGSPSSYNSTTGVFHILTGGGSGGGGGGQADSAYFWNRKGNQGTDTATAFLGTTDGKFLRIKTNGIQRAQFDTSGNLYLNSLGDASSTTPKYISSGGSYGTNAPGNYGNLKWRLYEPVGSPGSSFGIGMSANLMEFQTSGGAANFGFYNNHSSTSSLTISSTQIQTPYYFNTYTASTNHNCYVTYGPFATNNVSGIGNSAASVADLSLFAGVAKNILFAHSQDATTISTSNADMWINGGTGDIVATGASTDNNSKLQTTSFSAGYVAKTAAYTAGVADHTIECTSGTFTVTLPTAVGITGREYWITNTGSGTITIATTSSQTFPNVTGTPTTLTVAQFSNYKLVSNGAGYLAYKMVN